MLVSNLMMIIVVPLFIACLVRSFVLFDRLIRYVYDEDRDAWN